MGGELNATPTVTGNSVIVPVGFEQVVALRADTGAVIWRFKAGKMASFNNSAAVASNRVFVTGNGRLYALALGTGKLLWLRPMTAVHGPPALWNGELLIGHSGRSPRTHSRPELLSGIRRSRRATSRLRRSWTAWRTGPTESRCGRFRRIPARRYGRAERDRVLSGGLGERHLPA